MSGKDFCACVTKIFCFFREVFLGEFEKLVDFYFKICYN